NLRSVRRHQSFDDHIFINHVPVSVMVQNQRVQIPKMWRREYLSHELIVTCVEPPEFESGHPVKIGQGLDHTPQVDQLCCVADMANRSSVQKVSNGVCRSLQARAHALDKTPFKHPFVKLLPEVLGPRPAVLVE